MPSKKDAGADLMPETIQTASTKEDIAAEKKFPLNTLRGNSMKLFGVTSSTFAGVTENLPEGSYTMGEMKKNVDLWLKKEVR